MIPILAVTVKYGKNGKGGAEIWRRRFLAPRLTIKYAVHDAGRQADRHIKTSKNNNGKNDQKIKTKTRKEIDKQANRRTDRQTDRRRIIHTDIDRPTNATVQRLAPRPGPARRRRDQPGGQHTPRPTKAQLAHTGPGPLRARPDSQPETILDRPGSC